MVGPFPPGSRTGPLLPPYRAPVSYAWASSQPRQAVDLQYQSYYHPVHPAGVAVIMTLSFLSAAFLFLIFFLSLSRPSGPDRPYAIDRLAYLLPIPSMLAIGVGIALWKMYPWSRLLALVFYALCGLMFLALAFTHPFSAADVLNTVIPAAIVIYLSNPSVREAFVHRSHLDDDLDEAALSGPQRAIDNQQLTAQP